MKKYPSEMKCKVCGGKAVLMDFAKDFLYYYHYSTDYSQGCHQRIGVTDKTNMATLTNWSIEDEHKFIVEKKSEQIWTHFYKEDYEEKHGKL
jgi:hypothetical protein